MAAKDKKFSEVDEAIVVAALASNASFASNPNVQLGSLNSAQLCQLFDHCYLYNLGDFVLRNKLIGTPFVFNSLIHLLKVTIVAVQVLIWRMALIALKT